ncbi:uncharacterized protein LOC103524116 [Trichonephila clavipes]|nr:uncharacterized protein LOC103524116 [Trichonephila clavipes]
MVCNAEDCGFQKLNDDEIVTSVQEESDPVNDETDEDEDNNNNNNESGMDPSYADAFSALETAINWYEQQSECCPTQLLVLKRALSNYNENNCLRVQNCRELLGKIKGKIVFQWVLSHCGLWGNERADFLAKKGTGILQNFRRDLTLHSAKLEIKRIFRESFRLTASRVARDKPWSTLCKKSHGIPSSPRAAAVAKFRLLTGHDCLCAHLFRFNLVTSPICVLCDTGQDMTAAHLDECSALNDLNCIVKRYWRARCLMT